MKLLTRLLLLFPFALVTIFYVRFKLDDNRCFGLVHLGIILFFWAVLVATFVIAVVATFRKRPAEKFKAEPFSLTALLIVLVVLIVGQFFGETFKGSIWIQAESEGREGWPSRESLTFRKNKSFVVVLGGDDLSCQYTGNYKLVGDTVILDQHTVNITDHKLTTHYLRKESQLLPCTQQSGATFASFDIIKEN